MVTLLALVSAVRAAPVQCDALAASALLTDARIDESRAPLTHPELIPGLALASPGAPQDLRASLAEVCTGAPSLSISRTDSWEDAGWSAHAFRLTRSDEQGCSLYQRSVVISVGLSSGAAPVYRLRSRDPVTRTPIGDCADRATWHEEQVLRGADTGVRLVLSTDREEDHVLRTAVLVRRATPGGWHEEVLVEPAPQRLLGDGAGPTIDLAERNSPPWIVAHGDRSLVGGCRALGGQTVWTPEGDAWSEHTGRDALGLLAQGGLPRLAGDDGWMLVLAVFREYDSSRAQVRRNKLATRLPEGEQLHVFRSSDFPGLNPGFIIVAPAPWATREQAEQAMERWPRVPARAYVKQAWEAADPCAQTQSSDGPSSRVPLDGL